MMIDWLEFVAPWAHDDPSPGHPFFGGDVLSTRPDPTHPDGEVPDWIVRKRVKVVGSYSFGMQLQSTDLDGRRCVRISGNPAKLLQGHNVFGSDDLPGLVRAVLSAVTLRFGIWPSFDDLCDWRAGNIRLQRVDVTRSVDLGSVARVRSAIRALDLSARMRNRGRGRVFDGTTLSFGQGSSHWGLKMYAKGVELQAKGKDHRLPLSLGFRDELAVFADGLLRQEVQLRRRELEKLGLGSVSDWKPGTAAHVHNVKLSLVQVSEGNLMDSIDVQSLPLRLRFPYVAWKAGHDVRSLLSHNRFYVYRRELLSLGIDIAVKQPEPVKPAPGLAVDSLQSIVHGPEADVPSWAKGTALYFEPRSGTTG